MTYLVIIKLLLPSPSLPLSSNKAPALSTPDAPPTSVFTCCCERGYRVILMFAIPFIRSKSKPFAPYNCRAKL